MAGNRERGFWHGIGGWVSNKWQAVVNRILAPAILAIFRSSKGSWREKQIMIFCYALWKIPSNWLKGARVSNAQVATSYDQVSGNYIKYQKLKGHTHWAIVDGQPAKVSSIEIAKLFKEELCRDLGQPDFNSILEVGAGELNTLAHVAEHFGQDKQYLGIELSLNRLCHGYEHFCRKGALKAALAKSDACFLPFADKSVDVVYTAHCLELMPQKHYRKAIQEMCRVARKRVCLFEPSWELGGALPRLKMAAEKYVRGIPGFVQGMPQARLRDHRLLANTSNPFNRTALHLIELDPVSPSRWRGPEFVCPVCHGRLEDRGCYLLCRGCDHIYFNYESIPLLDPTYAHNVTCLLR